MGLSPNLCYNQGGSGLSPELEWIVLDCDYGVNSVINVQTTLAAASPSLGQTYSGSSFFLSLCCPGSLIPCEDFYRFSGVSSFANAFQEVSPGTAAVVFNTPLTFCSSLSPSVALRS